MAQAKVDGLTIGYEVVGTGRPWVLTPGGRFTKESPGLRELADALAEHGNQVLLWDRPNCGESDVCFAGPSESVMQADVLAGLLRELDMTPAVIAGGSGGARVSLLTAARLPEVTAGVAVWWISGGVYGLLTLAMHYCGESLRAAWTEGMEAVAALPEWQESIGRNPRNRDLLPRPGPPASSSPRWSGGCTPTAPAAATRCPACPTTRPDRSPFRRSCSAAARATRTTPGRPPSRSRRCCHRAELVEPPWGDREWLERQAAYAAGEGLFARWPLLAPQLLAWADRHIS